MWMLHVITMLHSASETYRAPSEVMLTLVRLSLRSVLQAKRRQRRPCVSAVGTN